MRTADVVVVGAGMAGLTVADACVRQSPGAAVQVLEADDRCGGQVATTMLNGYTVEHGPGQLTIDEPEMRSLVDRLCLVDRVQLVDERAGGLSIWVGGRLRRTPRSIGELLRTDVLSRAGLLRALAEPLLGGGPVVADESVQDFARRRFGPEFARVIAATVVHGMTGDDGKTTSLCALHPQLHALDHTAGHAGLLGAAVARAVIGRAWGRSPLHGRATVRDGGLAVLPNALGAALGDRLVLGCRIEDVRRGRFRRWAVLPAGRDPVEADVLVLAIPGRQAAPLLHAVAPAVATLLGQMSYNDMRMLAFGFRDTAFREVPQGFGFLTPPTEDLGIIGASITSNAFPEQAPAGRVLVRTFAGGVAHPEFLHLPRADAAEFVLSQLRRVWGVRGDPELLVDVAWPQALPQLALGHRTLVERVGAELRQHPGLNLIGNSYGAVGLTETVAEAARLARRITAELPTVRPFLQGGVGAPSCTQSDRWSR